MGKQKSSVFFILKKFLYFYFFRFMVQTDIFSFTNQFKEKL